MSDLINPYLIVPDVIAVLFSVVVALMVAYYLWGPKEPEENYRSKMVRKNIKRTR
mgnify:CR=1 FL=1